MVERIHHALLLHQGAKPSSCETMARSDTVGSSAKALCTVTEYHFDVDMLRHERFIAWHLTLQDTGFPAQFD